MNKQALVMKSGQAHPLSVLGTKVSFLCEGEHTGSAWSLMEVRLPKDAGPPPHHHEWDEAYYVVEGEVEFTLGTQNMTVKAGDFVYAPGGALHGFRGLSAAGAKMLIFDAPAHAARFFKEVDREVKGPGDMPNVPGIGTRNGIHFVNPS